MLQLRQTLKGLAGSAVGKSISSLCVHDGQGLPLSFVSTFDIKKNRVVLFKSSLYLHYVTLNVEGGRE